MIDRRKFLAGLAALPLFRLDPPAGQPHRRVRPGDPGWPGESEWSSLNKQVGGRLIRPDSPLEHCRAADKAEIAEVFDKTLKNPYAIGDDPALTQSTGWTDAWQTRPSQYAIAAERVGDVVAGVNFARKHNLRLVVKGGGHSYLGTSCAPDSLLIWTHRMDKVEVHDAFVPAGSQDQGVPAVSVQAGVRWMHAYQEVTEVHNRYVQGGGCGTVGVGGFIQGGGFGSCSKQFGTGAASLIEAEVVTARGDVLIANSHRNSDLLWALKGGGGGTFGVVTRMTLKTHDLPSHFSGMQGTIKAKSDAAFRRLIAQFVRHYCEHLMNPHWGETVVFRPDNSLNLAMFSQGLSQAEAQADWQPFFDWVSSHRDDYQWTKMPFILATEFRNMWSGEFWRKTMPSVMSVDDRPGASPTNMFWATNRGECGIFWDGYESVWLPQSLLKDSEIDGLVGALFDTTRLWDVELHFNKGLAGGRAEAIADSRETSTNVAVLDAFALAIIAGGQNPAYSGVSGREPDLVEGRKNQTSIAMAMKRLRRVVPKPGSYLNETSYFEKDWQKAFWGDHYERLLRIKRHYDPDGLFFVHHGVGSEHWSENGFTRLS